MLKYTNAEVTFREIPDEICLCINISGCKNNCKGCHSAWLANDVGEELNSDSLNHLIKSNIGISCVCLMGGDHDCKTVNNLAKLIQTTNLKSAWYSGKSEVSELIDIDNFDYIKLGPYIEELGPLNNPNTNQKLFKIENSELINITYKFWKR